MWIITQRSVGEVGRLLLISHLKSSDLYISTVAIVCFDSNIFYESETHSISSSFTKCKRITGMLLSLVFCNHMVTRYNFDTLFKLLTWLPVWLFFLILKIWIHKKNSEFSKTTNFCLQMLYNYYTTYIFTVCRRSIYKLFTKKRLNNIK